MKSTSRVSSAVRSAARSPARSMIGPGRGLDRRPAAPRPPRGRGSSCRRREGRRAGRGRGPRRGCARPRWRPGGWRRRAAGRRTRRGSAAAATGRSRRRRRSGRPETTRLCSTQRPATSCSARRRRSSKRPAPSSRERAVDRPLHLGARVAEVGQGGQQVVLGRGGRGRRGRCRLAGEQRRHLVLELEHEALRRLLADAGDARQAREVVSAQGGDEVRRRRCRRGCRWRAWGPTPATAIRRSKTSCSAAVRKPNRASVSSRTWVWMRRLELVAFVAHAVEGRHRDGDAVADAADVDHDFLRRLAQDAAAEVGDHEMPVRRRGARARRGRCRGGARGRAPPRARPRRRPPRRRRRGRGAAPPSSPPAPSPRARSR